MAAFLHRFVQAEDGLRLHVADYPADHPADYPAHHPGARADAPVLLCLPGLTRNGRDFARLAERLAGPGFGYRVLCPDQRGRGLSDRDPEPSHYQPPRYVADMAWLLDRLAIPQVTVIGTSLGGMMGVMLAAWQPERVRGVLLNDVGALLEPEGLARIAGYVGRQPAVDTLDEAIALTRAANAAVFPDWQHPEWRQMVLDTWRGEGGRWVPDYDPAIAQGLANGSAAPPLWPLFEAVKNLPMLLLRGALSDLLSRDTVTQMQARLPQLVAAEVPQRGHAPTLEEPAAWAALQAWLANLR
ncbi:alpha/beta fold hydrolase [Inhella sp.]|uniref:alpha/beta fold hydrolase n=1 Tax=Inhella sp. TaxID=1921806 RepID=UPI0035B31FF0